MSENVRRSAATGRYESNQRAAARAYVAVASKRRQPIPSRVMKLANGSDASKGSHNLADRPNGK